MWLLDAQTNANEWRMILTEVRKQIYYRGARDKSVLKMTICKRSDSGPVQRICISSNQLVFSLVCM